MNLNVIRAIFRRNFNSYFSNPTGYVFICVFVLLSSFAAFWPNEFFNNNLANLDQLNRYLPYILLVFIPAITMSVWAEERRQGTDELLLTIPASDLDVVLGKYLAAVAIYSVALLFSGVCNLGVLIALGSPDKGLFVGTYFGYWLVGLAMLAVGMVASFLTGNLTVGFVLGAVFNAPLAFAENADVILPSRWALQVKSWSLEEQFRDFGRGVISMSGVIYFLAIIAVMLYLCMVLIGRRHWQGGRDGQSMGGHFLVRALALALAAVGVTMVFHRYDSRADVTSERLNSLSTQTRKLIRELDPKHPVKVDAYVSPEVPESYVQTRLDLLSMLREFDQIAGNKVEVAVHPTSPLSEEADQAEKQFGITGQQVVSRNRGAINREQIFLGVAFTSGVKKVVVPFFDRGIPVEYELVRSICTVSQQDRKKVGVLSTDAKLYGGMNFQTFSSTPNEMLITELEKQYDVVQVNADSPIEEEMDVLLAVQPSSLTPEQMKNFVAAVKRGVPTAIFEDPFPAMRLDVPGTSQPKRPPQMNPFGGGPPPQPKGNIQELWTVLGVDFMGTKVVWQRYNPMPKLAAAASPEWVFVDQGASEDKPVFNAEDPVSSQMQLMLFLFPGSVTGLNASELKFKPLVMTGDLTGTVAVDEIMENSFMGRGGGLNPRRRFIRTNQYYTLAARISGALKKEDEFMSDAAAAPAEEESTPAPNEKADQASKPDEEKAGDGDAEDKDSGAKEAAKEAAPKEKDISVILVCDIDVLFSEFFNVRAQGSDPDREFEMDFDNVTFVLNALDDLAGDERFIEIRKRRPRHRILETIDAQTRDARDSAEKQRKQFNDEFDKAVAEAQKKFQDKIDSIQKQKGDPIEILQRVEMAREAGQRELQAKTDQLQKQRERDTTRIERELNLKVSSVQYWCKFFAVIIPPIPPLLVGLGVFFNRRAREREGVSKSRLR